VPERVYIETTIPSFYYNTRRSEEIRLMAEKTRHWWDTARSAYELCTSDLVITELERGDHPFKTQKLDLVRELALLEITAEAVRTGKPVYRCPGYARAARRGRVAPGARICSPLRYITDMEL
jgi:hypothetical protein